MNPTKVGFAQPTVLLLASWAVSFQRNRSSREGLAEQANARGEVLAPAFAKEGKLRDEEKNVTAIICLAERATELEGSTPGMLPATNS
jgi:hypothetical protein